MLLFLGSLIHSPSKLQAAVIDDLNWQEVREGESVPFILQAALAIGTITIPLYKDQCSAFLISDDVLMTNFHCIKSRYHAYEVTATFGENTYSCNKYIGSHKNLDYALLKCKNSPGISKGHLTLSPVAPQKNQAGFIIQQNCLSLKDEDCVPRALLSPGVIARIEYLKFTHNMDTIKSSSGSPIFSQEDMSVIGIHYGGIVDRYTGRGIRNYGRPMNKIREDILKRFPKVLL